MCSLMREWCRARTRARWLLREEATVGVSHASVELDDVAHAPSEVSGRCGRLACRRHICRWDV